MIARYGAIRTSATTFTLMVLLCLADVAIAQQPLSTPSVDRGFQAKATPQPLYIGRRIVVSIGIDQYASWPKLKTAVSDAREFSQLLIDRFGFQQLEEPLIDATATKNNIQSLVEDRLPRQLKKDDDVVFFFAGHGTTRTDEVGGEKVDTGYLIPVLASSPGTEEHWSDYIQTNELLEEIGRLPAQHILVILDACHGGFALGKAMQSFRDSPRYQADVARNISRRVITSARKSQLASDDGPVPNHSLFTGLILQGLDWGKADLDGNGVVTSSELGLYIQQAVGQASGSQQTPDFGSFYFDDRGEMVLPLNDHTYAGIKSQGFSALRWAEYGKFRELVARAVELRPEAPETLYLRYRLSMLDKRIDDAADIVNRLIDINVAEGQIPLSRDDLWNLKERLPYWKPVLLLPEQPFPAQLRLEVGPNEGQFSAVEKINLGDTRAYSVKPHLLFHWRVSNVSKQTIYLYALGIDQDGRLFPFSLWNPGPVLTDGLRPESTGISAPFRQDGELEMQAFHFIASPRLIYALLSPVSVATRAISRLDAADLAGATQAVERYTTMDVSAHESNSVLRRSPCPSECVGVVWSPLKDAVRSQSNSSL